MGRAASRWLTAHWVGAVAVAGFVVLGGVFAVPAVARYGDDHLGGQTRRITLEWQCSNHIEWSQPGTSWTWLAIYDRELSPELARSGESDDDGDWVTQRVRGDLRFDSHTRATFTSDAGSTLRFERHREPFFRTLGCAIGGPTTG